MISDSVLVSFLKISTPNSRCEILTDNMTFCFQKHLTKHVCKTKSFIWCIPPNNQHMHHKESTIRQDITGHSEHLQK
jgi:hypothetical protein